ncbi:MAG: AmmeMemoRadiSam system radical SAM enzyme [Candidatus Woesearchaeota archaeon]
MAKQEKNLHESKYYKKDFKGKKGIVQCELCPYYCVIPEGGIGNCHARKNIEGKLYSLVYGKSVAASVDPIEKKPLFHFLPSTGVYSVGTIGCNLHCLHCQNYNTSQALKGTYEEVEMSPEKIVEQALANDCASIAATYNEPTIFFEYMLDIFKLAKKRGLKTVMVTNGYMNKEPAQELAPYLDGLNIDLKAFNEKFYKEISGGAKLQPVLDRIKFWHGKKKWVEITTLIIPTLNDDLEEIEKMCRWIIENVGDEVPLHFTAFYPTYKLMDKKPTSEKILVKAYEIAKKTGLKYVYVGNIYAGDKEHTFCPKCGEVVVKRVAYNIMEINIKKGKCSFCKKTIPGVWN